MGAPPIAPRVAEVLKASPDALSRVELVFQDDSQVASDGGYLQVEYLANGATLRKLRRAAAG